MIICGVKYFLATVENENICELLKYALDYSQKRVQTITHMHGTIPNSSRPNQVLTEAPRLFSDTMILLYMLNMCSFDLSAQSVMHSLSTRDDTDAFYSECIAQTRELSD